MTGHRYLEVAADVRDRIALGEVGPGGALESEAALSARHAVSRATTRRALLHLRDAGLVESRRGAGWFVRGSSYSQPLAVGTFRHASSALADAGTRRTVLDFGWVPAPAPTAALLGVAPATSLLRGVALREAGGIPLDVATEWVADDAAGSLSRDAATHPGIWATLEAAGHHVARVRQTVTAGVAGDQDAARLACAPGDPLLLVRRLAVRADGGAVALAEHRYLAHRFSLEVEFTGWRAAGTSGPVGLRSVPSA